MDNKEHINAKKNIALKFIMIFFVTGVFIITLIVFLVSFVFGHDALVQKVSSAGTAFALWRLLVFITLVAGWNYWIEKLSNWMHLSDEKKYSILTIDGVLHYGYW